MGASASTRGFESAREGAKPSMARVLSRVRAEHLISKTASTLYQYAEPMRSDASQSTDDETARRRVGVG
eukprot:1948351-Pleurochrysis_carterae.AAC.1